MGNFTTKQEFFLFSCDIDVKEMEKINGLLQLLEDSGVSTIIEKATANENYQGRTGYDPLDMLAVILYAFARNNGTLREIETACKMDLGHMYIMENMRPSYVSIHNYIQQVILPNKDQIFYTIMKEMMKKMNIDYSDVFLDGSKFEANSNKYKFVWKPTKRQADLSNKVRAAMSEFGIINNNKIIDSAEIASYISFVKKDLEIENIQVNNIIRGKGHRLLPKQKQYLLLTEYLKKELVYEEQIRICGPNRNSYFKTDFDATAMCLKEDYYSGLGSNMHAAYNVQYIVSKGLILVVYISQDRNDYYTFIPTIEKFNEMYGKYPENVCADSGYGSHMNYKYIIDKAIGNYVKYPSWEQEMSGKTNLFRLDNDENIICLNGKIGVETTTSGRHAKRADSKIYEFKGCLKCPYKTYCKKSLKVKTGNTRISEISKEYLKEIDLARKNLLSVKGIEMRVNRSIQIEGNFGNIKQNYSYNRFRRKGLNSSILEMMLYALGSNIRKFFRFISSKSIPEFWRAPDGILPEEMPKIKIPKKTKKPTNNPNSIAKKGYKNKYNRTKKAAKKELKNSIS